MYCVYTVQLESIGAALCLITDGSSPVFPFTEEGKRKKSRLKVKCTTTTCGVEMAFFFVKSLRGRNLKWLRVFNF